MAIYSLIVSRISRSDGRSALAAAAYRSGSRLHDKRTGQTFDYKRRKGITDSFITLPDHAPDWASDRLALWNEAETAERRKNSTVAREFMIALPAELSLEQRRELVQRFACALVDIYGFAIDTAIHEPSKKGDDRNYHAHLLASPRVLTTEGFKEKTRVLDDSITGPKEITKIREMWASFVNEALEKAQIDARIDHRSNVMIAADKKDEIEQLEKEATALEASASKINSFSDIKNGIKAVLPHLSALFVRNPVEKAAILREKIESLYSQVSMLSQPILAHQGVVKTAIKRKEQERQAKELAARQEAERLAGVRAERQEVERLANIRAAQPKTKPLGSTPEGRERAKRRAEELAARQEAELQARAMQKAERQAKARAMRKEVEDRANKDLRLIFKANAFDTSEASDLIEYLIDFRKKISDISNANADQKPEFIKALTNNKFIEKLALCVVNSIPYKEDYENYSNPIIQVLKIENFLTLDKRYTKILCENINFEFAHDMLINNIAESVYSNSKSRTIEDQEKSLITLYYKLEKGLSLFPNPAPEITNLEPKVEPKAKPKIEPEELDNNNHYDWNNGPSM